MNHLFNEMAEEWDKNGITGIKLVGAAFVEPCVALSRNAQYILGISWRLNDK